MIHIFILLVLWHWLKMRSHDYYTSSAKTLKGSKMPTPQGLLEMTIKLKVWVWAGL
ncbi:hypothetical protein [Phormidium nigroviride]